MSEMSEEETCRLGLVDTSTKATSISSEATMGGQVDKSTKSTSMYIYGYVMYIYGYVPADIHVL